ncbi:hypothetical protein [Microcoleus sp. B3-A4]
MVKRQGWSFNRCEKKRFEILSSRGAVNLKSQISNLKPNIFACNALI